MWFGRNQRPDEAAAEYRMIVMLLGRGVDRGLEVSANLTDDDHEETTARLHDQTHDLMHALPSYQPHN